METKFKIGDRVKCVITHRERADYDAPESVLGTVKRTTSSGAVVLWDGEQEEGKKWASIMNVKEIQLVKNGKTTKPKPYKFALQYELDKDPTEYFHDIKEVKARVKELAADSSLKRDQIFVHEIKSTKQIKINTIIGFKFVSIA